MLDFTKQPSLPLAVLEALLGALIFPTAFHLAIKILSITLSKEIPSHVIADAACKLVSSIFAVITCSVGATGKRTKVV